MSRWAHATCPGCGLALPGHLCRGSGGACPACGARLAAEPVRDRMLMLGMLALVFGPFALAGLLVWYHRAAPGWLEWVAIVAVLGGLLTARLLWWLMPFLRRFDFDQSDETQSPAFLPMPNAEPRCPACGYLLYGLRGAECPECGREVPYELRRLRAPNPDRSTTDRSTNRPPDRSALSDQTGGS